MLAFGVVAPETTHRASLEEYSGADARSVVQGEALDVENYICRNHGGTVKAGNCNGEGGNDSGLPWSLKVQKVHSSRSLSFDYPVLIRSFFDEIQAQGEREGSRSEEETQKSKWSFPYETL